MYFNDAFRKIGDSDVAEMQRLVATLTEKQWKQQEQRQKTYKVHSTTQTIPLIFDADFRHKFPTKLPLFDTFNTEISNTTNIIERYFTANVTQQKNTRPIKFRRSYFIRIILVKLKAGTQIDTHTDFGYSLSRAHRVHWPIVTNEKVEFTINGKIKVMQEGELWEVNNRLPHSVINAGDNDRVHAILDFVLPNELILDPNEGDLYA